MRRHDDRPGDAGGYPNERQHGGASFGAGALDPAGNQGPGAHNYNYYYDEDPGYSDGAPTAVVSPSSHSDDYYDELGSKGRPFGWNAGTDLGLLILRLALGGTFAAHGAQTLGILPGSATGPDAFAQSLQQDGFRESALLSLITGGTQLGSGALLILGLFTPLAAAGVLGLMISAVALQVPGPFFLADGGYEFVGMLGAMALGLLFTGPGRVALDKGRAWFRRPMISGSICMVIAAAAAAAVLLLFR